MSPLVPTSELSAMRSSILDLLPDTCHILTATNAADGMGGVTQTWGTATANVSCRVDYVRGHEAQRGDKITPFTGFMFSLPFDTPVTTDNRIKYGSDTYSIQSINAAQSWSLVLRIAAEKL